MKLFLFVFLVGIALANVEPKCKDVWGTCDDFVGCTETMNCNCNNSEVRRGCRKSCNTCDGYDNLRPTGPIAVVYGGNHVLTWDRLPFDCTVRGEIVLYKNSETGMRVHALFTRPDGLNNTVITAVTFIGSEDEPRLQIAVNRSLSQSSKGVCSKNLLFWYGDEQVSVEKVEQLGGYRGISTLFEIFQPFAYVLDVRSGSRVVLSLGHGSEYGCYFDLFEMLLDEAMVNHSTGLLGSPDNNIQNEWTKSDGTVLEIAPRIGRHLGPAFFYTKSHWCIRKSENSKMRYDCLGTFEQHMGCMEGYNGLRNFKDATAEMRSVCGQYNYECLHDAISTGKAQQGAITNIMMRDAYAFVTPAKGMSAQPIGIRAGISWPVRISVSIGNGAIPGLDGFRLWTLNPNDLSKNRRTKVILQRSGQDAEKNITVYSGDVELTLSNGFTKGYAAVPLIGGDVQNESDDPYLVLPNVIRAFSDESGRFVPVEGNNMIVLNTVASVELVVRFLFPEEESNSVGVKFQTYFSGTERDCGTNEDSTFVKFAPTFGDNAIKINVKKAFKAFKFESIAQFSLYGHRLGEGNEAISLSVDVLRNGVVTDLLRISVKPSTASGCPLHREESLLAYVNVRYTSEDLWNILLSHA